MHMIVVEAEGVDGRQYRAELGLLFPTDSRITQVNEAPSPPPNTLGACCGSPYLEGELPPFPLDPQDLAGFFFRSCISRAFFCGQLLSGSAFQTLTSRKRAHFPPPVLSSR
jgi:hypothetical protein